MSAGFTHRPELSMGYRASGILRSSIRPIYSKVGCPNVRVPSARCPPETRGDKPLPSRKEQIHADQE